VERSGRGVVLDTVPKFAWKNVGNLRKTLVRIVDVPTKIRTRHIPNTSKMRYRLSQRARFASECLQYFTDGINLLNCVTYISS
jgi:hypothetical protein